VSQRLLLPVLALILWRHVNLEGLDSVGMEADGSGGSSLEAGEDGDGQLVDPRVNVRDSLGQSIRRDHHYA